MRVLQLAFVLVLTIFNVATSYAIDDPHDPYKHFFNETWGDLPEELNKAKQEGKAADKY